MHGKKRTGENSQWRPLESDAPPLPHDNIIVHLLPWEAVSNKSLQTPSFMLCLSFWLMRMFFFSRFFTCEINTKSGKCYGVIPYHNFASANILILKNSHKHLRANSFVYPFRRKIWKLIVLANDSEKWSEIKLSFDARFCLFSSSEVNRNC